MFAALLRASLVLPYTQLELCNKSQLDALFILSLFGQSISTFEFGVYWSVHRRDK
jgi:hypothetical protein